jgi:AraC family transcriptional regulator of adaptative response / DNA-3-methyladenine glycosylase II
MPARGTSPQRGADDAGLYAVFQARDARFDGRVFVGVTSTGIYCRPVCRVRTPMRKNCRFFDTRAQAEAAAFRPCMKCRPEIAPGLSAMDSSRTLADTAARSIEHAVHRGASLALPALAARLGVTDRHLRRIFQATHGVSPHQYLDTQRLLLAKQLLTDTAQPITQVALASGFDSLRRFNAAFVQRYRFKPTQLRRRQGSSCGAKNRP